MKKKYLWFLMFLIPVFVVVWVLASQVFEGEVSDNIQIDAGYNLLSNDVGKITKKIPELEMIEITQVYHDGKRLFITLTSSDNELINHIITLEHISLSYNEENIKPDVLAKENHNLILIYNNFDNIKDNQLCNIRIQYKDSIFNSEVFEIKIGKITYLEPSKESFEELKIVSAELAGYTLQISGIIIARVDIGTLQIEQGREWVNTAFYMDKESIEDGKCKFTAAFTIHDVSSLNFNLIINDENKNVASIIPFVLKVKES